MPEYCTTCPTTTTCFNVQTADRACQNRRILQLKIMCAASVKNPISRIFAARQPLLPPGNPNACRCHGLASTIGGMNPGFSRTAVFFFALAFATAATAEEPKTPSAVTPASIVPTEYLVIPAVGQYGRLPLQRDGVEAQLVTGTWKEPTAGTTLKSADG